MTAARLPEPGHDLDALVAEHVFHDAGRKVWYASTDGGKSGRLFTDGMISKRNVEEWIAKHPVVEGLPMALCSYVRHDAYSTNPDHVVGLVDFLKDRGHLPSLTWKCGIFRDASRMGWWVEFRNVDAWAYHENVAAAACYAALLAVGHPDAVADRAERVGAWGR